MSTDVSEFFATTIDAYRGLSGKALDRALSRLLRAFQGHIWGWSRTACRTHGDREFMYVDDVFNVISLELSIALRKELMLESDPPIVNFYAFFSKISQRKAFAFFHSGERTGFSNASGATRRASKINKTRKELSIANGREPSDQEIVDEVNRMAHMTRVNPEKQGALVTLDDLKLTSFMSLDGLVEDFGDATFVPDSEDEPAISVVEAPALITYIVTGCYERSVVLGDVAQAWIGEALSGENHVRSESEIAELLSLKRGAVSGYLDECKVIAVEVCAQKFAISSPFV